MLRGRPVKSPIRQNIVEILYYLGNGYGYQIAKIYQEIFPSVTQRSIYYHLRKGMQTKEIEEKEVRMEKGNFSWGGIAEKTYYILGPRAEPQGKIKVKEFLNQWKR